MKTTITTHDENSRRNAFAALITRYERSVVNPETTPDEQTDALYALARAVTNSVTRKLLTLTRKAVADAEKRADAQAQENNDARAVDAPSRDYGGDGYISVMFTLRRELSEGLRTLSRTAYIMDDSYDLEYDRDGNIITRGPDAETQRDVNKLCGMTLGDGVDLLHDAVVAILDVTRAEGDKFGVGCLELPRTIRVPNTKVRGRELDIDSDYDYVNKDTTYIQQIFREVRSKVRKHRHIQAIDHKIRYIMDAICDVWSDDVQYIYRPIADVRDEIGELVDRLSDIPDASDAREKELVRKIAAAGLSAMEVKVLRAVYTGAGYTAISRAMGVSKNTVATYIRRIRAKAVKAGITL